jgi:hypothetical protein
MTATSRRIYLSNVSQAALLKVFPSPCWVIRMKNLKRSMKDGGVTCPMWVRAHAYIVEFMPVIRSFSHALLTPGLSLDRRRLGL